MLDALHFILDSWWNTFVVLLLAGLFRPVRITMENTYEAPIASTKGE